MYVVQVFLLDMLDSRQPAAKANGSTLKYPKPLPHNKVVWSRFLQQWQGKQQAHLVISKFRQGLANSTSSEQSTPVLQPQDAPGAARMRWGGTQLNSCSQLIRPHP
jgi:hypothetical protein